jgi:hypothetical protein
MEVNRSFYNSRIFKKLFINSSSCLARIFCGFFCMLLVLCLSACGHTASKASLLSYAEKNYGKCKLIREEHSGKGNDEIRTLYLQDLDTGLEYYLTSKMVSQGLDGSEFIHFEQKSSDFAEKYKKYIYDLSEQAILKLNTGHPARIMLSESLFENKIIFDNRTSDDDSKMVCKKIAEIIADNDKKNYLSISFLVYCENENICIGHYNYSDDTFVSYGPYVVIDYVHNNVDKGAEYLNSISGTLSSYLSNEDMEKITANDTFGKFYFFRSSTGVKFVAFNMKEFGMDGIRCVTVDTREEFTLSPTLQ